MSNTTDKRADDAHGTQAPTAGPHAYHKPAPVDERTMVTGWVRGVVATLAVAGPVFATWMVVVASNDRADADRRYEQLFDEVKTLANYARATNDLTLRVQERLNHHLTEAGYWKSEIQKIDDRVGGLEAAPDPCQDRFTGEDGKRHRALIDALERRLDLIEIEHLQIEGKLGWDFNRGHGRPSSTWPVSGKPDRTRNYSGKKDYHDAHTDDEDSNRE